MRKIVLMILLCCLSFQLYAWQPQRRKKNKPVVEVEAEAVADLKYKPVRYVNISSKKLAYKSIKGYVEKSVKEGCDTLFIAVFSNKGAAVKSPTFENLHTKDNFFVNSASLTPKQLSNIVALGGSTKIIVVVNLFNNNDNFRTEVGHPLFSNEGMRFIDDYMKHIFYENNIFMCRINTNCTPKEQVMFVDPLVKKMSGVGVNVILNKY